MISNISTDISISFEYYIFDTQQCCKVPFKISLCVNNMRLHRVQQWVLHGDLFINNNNIPSMKSATRRHVVGLMKNYFKINSEVMPATGR